MKKISNLFKRHKVLGILILVTIAVILILLYFFLTMFISNGNEYGDRLDGIEEVEIENSTLNDIEASIEEKTEVESASLRIQGKIIYFNIVFNNDVSKDKAKEIANATLDSFSSDEKSFYDFEYLLTQVGSDDEDDETEYFAIAGTKHSSKDTITYTNN